MQEDEADFEFGRFVRGGGAVSAAVAGFFAAAGAQRENHDHDEKQSSDFLHVFDSSK